MNFSTYRGNQRNLNFKRRGLQETLSDLDLWETASSRLYDIRKM